MSIYGFIDYMLGQSPMVVAVVFTGLLSYWVVSVLFD